MIVLFFIGVFISALYYGYKNTTYSSMILIAYILTAAGLGLQESGYYPGIDIKYMTVDMVWAIGSTCAHSAISMIIIFMHYDRRLKDNDEKEGKCSGC